jgi:hypothetical protein
MVVFTALGHADAAPTQDASAPMPIQPDTTTTAARPAHEQQTLPARPSPGADARDTGPGMGDYFIMGGVLVGAIVLLRQLTRRKKSRAGTPESAGTPRERLESIRAGAASSRAPADAAAAEAEAISRRLAGALDAKAARLEVLIEHAESVLARLEAALSAVPARPRASDRLADRPADRLGDRPGDRLAERAADEPEPAPLARIDPGLLDRARLDQLRRERGTDAPPARPQSTPRDPFAAPLPPAPAASAAPAGLGKHESARARAFALADQGRTIEEIARELARPVAEVELMLRLRRSS